MTSITLDLFSGKGLPVTAISVPVVSLSDYHDRLSRFVKKRTSREALIGHQNNLVCREMFQLDQKELFFLPCCRGKHVSLDTSISGNLFFLKGVYDWNFILIFAPEEGSRIFLETRLSKFTQEDTYPEGANSASFFFLSANCASILVSEHGCIAKDSEGKLFFQGITVSLLQTLNHQCKSIFVQRRDIFASPSHPLREEDLSSLEPRTCKFIKISCFCRKKNFSYLTHFPVLTPGEVQKKLNNNAEKRLEKYGASSLRYRTSYTKQKLSKEESSNPLLIVLPPVMEADVPFGSCREGELFFSYSDQSSLTLQLLFFPYLFDVNQTRPKKTRQCSENWHIENIGTLVKYCEVTSATFFSFPGIKLVPSLASEYKISGMKIALVSAPRGNCWGVFCSPEKKIPLSASFSKSTGSIDNHTPGTSGLEYSEPAASLSQPIVTVSVSPEKQGKQTQKRKRSPVPGPSGVSFRPYKPLPFCEGRSPIIPHSQAVSNVFSAPERESQHTQQKSSSPVPGPSGVSFHPYKPLPFCEGRSPIIPHSQAVSNVFSAPERESQHTQQKSSSPVPGPSGVSFHPYKPLPFCEGRSPIIPHSQAVSNVFSAPERESQHTQQKSSSPVPGPSEVRHSVIYPIPFDSQAAATVSDPVEQTQHTQQRRSNPVPGPSGISFYSYPQYGMLPFSEEFHPYSYPGTGSFVEGFYPYGSSFPPYPHSSVTQDQWMPVFPPSASVIRPSFAALEPLRYDIPVQEGVGNFGRAEEASTEVPVGAIQQKPIWRPYESPSSISVSPQAQAENSSEETD